MKDVSVDSPLPLSEAELALIERVRCLSGEPNEELMKLLCEEADDALLSLQYQAMFALCRLVPKEPPKWMVMIAQEEYDRLRADLTAKESMIRSMADSQGKEWAESVRISELEADLAAAQERLEAKDAPQVECLKCGRIWFGISEPVEHLCQNELAERLGKAEAALRRIAAGTFKPDEIARAAIGKRAELETTPVRLTQEQTTANALSNMPRLGKEDTNGNWPSRTNA